MLQPLQYLILIPATMSVFYTIPWVPGSFWVFRHLSELLLCVLSSEFSPFTLLDVLFFFQTH